MVAREKEREQEREEDGMNGAEESQGKHGMKMERARVLLDSEIEIQLLLQRRRVKEKAAGRVFV